MLLHKTVRTHHITFLPSHAIRDAQTGLDCQEKPCYCPGSVDQMCACVWGTYLLQVYSQAPDLRGVWSEGNAPSADLRMISALQQLM